MATIKDVARRAGVSTATVSHVINSTRVVSPATREQVLAAIDELNYRPSAVARGLTTNSTKTIGVVISDIMSPFFASLLHELESLLSKQNYNLFVCNTYEEVEREAHNLELLLDKRVDGVIITPTGHNQPVYSYFNQLGIPLVFIDRKPNNVVGSFVGVDNYRASYEVVNYLLSLGHRRIGLVSLVPQTSAVVARLTGYREALTGFGLDFDASLMKSSDFQIKNAVAAAQELLTLSERPSAIIASSHVATLGTLQALLSLDMRYPDDVSLVCFDNSRWTNLIQPALTVVTKPIQEMALIAVDTMLDALDHAEKQRKSYEELEKFATTDILMESTLIVRESCRPI